MNIRELSVEPREALGKGAVGRLRRNGLVPAVLYGGGNAPLTLSVSPTEVQRTIHGHGAGGVLVNLKLPGDAEPRAAVVRELQYDPVRDTLIHIDFQAVRMDEEISWPGYNNLYNRSDHANYARYGIPIVFFFTGLHGDYHQVTDEPQYIDYPHYTRITRYINDLMIELGNRDRRPAVEQVTNEIR